MKLPRLFSGSLVCAVGLLMSAAGVQAQDSAPVSVPILTPSTGFYYGYAGWQSLGTVQTKSAEGVALKGPAAGGAGFILNPPVDLTGATQLVVKIKVGASNTAGKLVFKIVEVAEWPIDLSTVSSTEFTVIKLPLAKGGQPIPAEKLKAVKSVQVQGDFTPTHVVDVVFGSITATGNP
jgi:hypothetical protein